MRLSSVAALAAAFALATLSAHAAAPSERRISALVVPMDKAAEAMSLKLELYLNDALKEYQGFSLKTSDELFGVSSDEDAAASLKRAELGFTESKTAFDARSYEDAERKLRATIKEFGKSVAAMKSCGHLCEAVAMYGAVLQARGDEEEAKIAVLDLLALGPSYELDRKRFPQDFLALKSKVSGSRNAMLRGNIHVRSHPAGARVYLDGEFRGYTPTTLTMLPIGKHLIKIERPGFRQVGVMAEATPEDQDLVNDLVATSAYKAYDGLLDRLAGEALKDKGGGTMSSIGSSLKLDRAIVAVLKELDAGGASELILVYSDLKTGRRLSAKRATFQGDEFGQLKGEVERMVNALVNSGETGEQKVSRTGDPLDNRHGMEEWNADDRGGRNTQRDKKKKGGDPLDNRSGMEDW